MRYNIIKFIEPLATAAADALTALLRHEIAAGNLVLDG